MPIICNNCGQRLPDDAVFCTKCGSKVTPIRCSGCGAVLTADAKFCPNCGTPVGDVTPPVEQVQQTIEVQKAPTEPEIASSKAAQSPPIQTSATDAPKQAANRFDWKYWSVSILRGYGTTRNTVEVTDEDVVITSKLNKRTIYDAVKVPLKNIASVEVWEKVSVISSLMVAVLVGLFVGIMVLIPFGVTAIDPSSAEGIGTMAGITILVAWVIWTGLFRMHHWRITIKTHKEPQYIIYEVSAKPKDREILFQLQKAILDQTGIQGEPIRKKSNKLVPTIVISVVAVIAIITVMLLSRFAQWQAEDSINGNFNEYEDPLNTLNDEKNSSDAQVRISPEDLIGRWELRYGESDGKSFRDALAGQGYTDDYIESYFANAYIQFFDDNSLEVAVWDETDASALLRHGTWFNTGKEVVMTERESGAQSTGTLENGIFCIKADTEILEYQHVSNTPVRTSVSGTISNQLENYVGTWFASSKDESTGFPVDIYDPSSGDFDGIQLELYKLNNNYYASLQRARSEKFTNGNDSVLPVEQVNDSMFTVSFDCDVDGQSLHPGNIEYSGRLILTINPAGGLFGEMHCGDEEIFSKMPLSNAGEWRGGRYAGYDELNSILSVSNAESQLTAEDRALSAIDMEAIFSRYVEGVWYSDTTIWDFYPYDIHITQGIFTNFRGNVSFGFVFRGNWDSEHIYELESNYFSAFSRDDVILYIDGEEFRQNNY